MQKNSKFISVKFPNIKISKLILWCVFLMLPGSFLIAMELEDASLLTSHEYAHYGPKKNVPLSAICANVLKIRAPENFFYSAYKKNLKTIIYGKPAALSFKTEVTTNPFYGTVDLWEMIPSSKKLAGRRSWFGVIETDGLDPELIREHLNRFTSDTSAMTERLKDNPKNLEEYITIRSGILRFFKLRVRNYHEERISNVDIMIPITCSTCGSANCAAGGAACAAGHPWVAALFWSVGTIEELLAYGCIYSLATNKKVRTQQFCFTASDFQKICAIKKSLKKARKDVLKCSKQ